MSKEKKIIAIATLYKPNILDLLKNFQYVFAFCDTVIFIDNTPGGSHILNLPNNVILLSENRNLGLPKALNKGITLARNLDAGVVFLFDQDSFPDLGLLKRQSQFVYVNRKNNVIIGPKFVASIDNEYADEFDDLDLIKKLCLPTSGMTFWLPKIPKNILFNESLFLDLVDFDWCFQLRPKGFSFFAAQNSRLIHQLGIRQIKFLTLTINVPEPYRHYYQVRDTLKLVFYPHAPIRAKLRLISVLPIKLALYPFVLDRGLIRLYWMTKGFIGAIKNETGVGSVKQLQQNS